MDGAASLSVQHAAGRTSDERQGNKDKGGLQREKRPKAELGFVLYDLLAASDLTSYCAIIFTAVISQERFKDGRYHSSRTEDKLKCRSLKFLAHSCSFSALHVPPYNVFAWCIRPCTSFPTRVHCVCVLSSAACRQFTRGVVEQAPWRRTNLKV